MLCFTNYIYVKIWNICVKYDQNLNYIKVRWKIV